MVCLGCLGSVFGLKTTKTISTTQAIIASIGIVVFYFATMFMTTNPYNIVSSNRGIVIALGAIALVLGVLIALKELNYIQFKTLIL